MAAALGRGLVRGDGSGWARQECCPQHRQSEANVVSPRLRCPNSATLIGMSSTDHMAALRAASANDSALHAEIAACRTVEDLVAVAARHGFEFDAAEFSAAGRGELTDADLESAAGGTLPSTELSQCWNPRTNSWCTFMC